MVKASEINGSSVAPFLNKCYEMVEEDHSTDSVISWTQAGDSFLILDLSTFSLTLLPNYFKHNNFSSFVRKLNIYTLHKVEMDKRDGKFGPQPVMAVAPVQLMSRIDQSVPPSVGYAPQPAYGQPYGYPPTQPATQGYPATGYPLATYPPPGYPPFGYSR